MSLEQHLRHELRQKVSSDWAHMEDLMRTVRETEPGSIEQTVAISHAFDWATEMADEYEADAA